MHEIIAAFPSETLYDSSLISAESVAKRTLLDLPSITDATTEDAKDVLQSTVMFFDTAGCEFYERSEGEGESGKLQKGALGEGSKSNENEAAVVCNWARKLVSVASFCVYRGVPGVMIVGLVGLVDRVTEQAVV
jgi:DNA polymerase alpha-associated DNA helicase A